MNKSAFIKAAFFASILVLSVGIGAAAYQITLQGGSTVPTNISDEGPINQIVQVENTNDGDPVTPEVLSDIDYEVNHIYNTSTGVRENMSHLYEGYYHSNLSVNNADGRYATFEVRDDADVILDNTTVTYDIGNLSVDILNDKDELHDNMKFGEQFTAEVNASVNSTGQYQFEDQADVDLWFSNGNWTSDVYQIKNPGDGYFFNSKVYIPDNPDATYIMYVNASYDSASYDDAYGARSMVINTLPQIKAEFDDISAGESCNNNSFFKACERNATITPELNITKSSAENVNMSLEAKNSTGGWENITTKKASLEEGLYSADFEVPDLDTSIYQKEMRIKYNATSPKRTDIGHYNFDYKTFKTFFRSASTTQAGEYNLNVEFRKFFTPEPLNSTRISGDIEIYQPNGDEFLSTTVDQMSYDEVEGWFTETLDLPYDEHEGIWTVEVNASNTFGDFKESITTFQLVDVEQTFDSETELEREIDYRGVQEFDLRVQNLRSNEIEIKPEIGEEIQEFTEVNNGNNLTLSVDEESNFTVEMNITEVEEHEGEIKLKDTDSNYNRTVDVSISAPTCVYKVGPVCIQESLPEVKIDEFGHETETLTARYIGYEDEATNLTASTEGNISQYVEVTPSESKMNSTQNSEEIELNYSARTPGYFTGNLTLETEENDFKMDMVLNSTIEPRDASIELSGSTDFGSIEEGKDAEIQIDVENTGNAEVEGLEYSSSTYDVEGESTSIPVGEQVERNITLNDVTSDSGQLTVTASTPNAGEVSRTISISGNPVPNYVDMSSDLETQLTDLDAQIPQDSQLQSELSSVQTTISDVKSAYRDGNFDRAETLYEEASNQIDTISQRADQLEQGDNNNDNQDGTDNPNNSGGGGILILIVLIIVFLGLGFIVYSSYIPEEGDPLYEVLGE